MRRRRDKWDTRNSVTRFSDNFVYLESWQLTTFSWFCTLGYFNLYFLCIHQIFGSNAKSSTGNLLCLAWQRNAIHFCMVTGVILPALTCVASSTQLIHGDSQCLMSFNAQSAKAHGSCHKMFYNALYWLHLVDRCRFNSFFPAKQITKEDRSLFLNSW